MENSYEFIFCGEGVCIILDYNRINCYLYLREKNIYFGIYCDLILLSIKIDFGLCGSVFGYLCCSDSLKMSMDASRILQK